MRGMNDQSDYQVLANQRSGAANPPLAELKQRVLHWLQHEAGFAQVYSINKAGFPVGRTMGAPVDDDFTVYLVQRNVHKRINQWKRNPKMEILWVGTPAEGSRNDSPHVYDFDLLAPRTVFLRGEAEFIDDATLIEVFQRQTKIHRDRGWTKAPLRDPENITDQLIGVRVRPIQIRVEGFGNGPESFTWQMGG